MRSGHMQHFAAKVSERRRLLGLTLVDVHRSGGPTAPTLMKAEAGELDLPRPSTLSKFDTGLQWMPGSAARTYWDGQEPRPRERSRTTRPLEPGTDAVWLPLEHALQLLVAQSRLTELVDGAHRPVAVSELEPLVDRLRDTISMIVGHFVTDLLERNRTEDRQTTQPLIEFAFAELLSEPVDDDDPERLEKLYRRWLLGKASELPDDTIASFRRRWRRQTRSRGPNDN